MNKVEKMSFSATNLGQLDEYFLDPSVLFKKLVLKKSVGIAISNESTSYSQIDNTLLT
jgi:hypothetical protein